MSKLHKKNCCQTIHSTNGAHTNTLTAETLRKTDMYKNDIKM